MEIFDIDSSAKVDKEYIAIIKKSFYNNTYWQSFQIITVNNINLFILIYHSIDKFKIL